MFISFAMESIQYTYLHLSVFTNTHLAFCFPVLLMLHQFINQEKNRLQITCFLNFEHHFTIQILKFIKFFKKDLSPCVASFVEQLSYQSTYFQVPKNRPPANFFAKKFPTLTTLIRTPRLLVFQFFLRKTIFSLRNSKF